MDLLAQVRVLHEDDWILAVDKPSGLAVHPGAGLHAGTLDDWIARHLGPRAVRNGFRASAAHRLDRDTSGVLVVAKRRPAMQRLTDAFARRQVHKRYLALVRGAMEQDAGLVDLPLAERNQSAKSLAHKGEKLQEARTRWEVVRRFEGATLVACEPLTGRTHQIRRHLAHMGHPLAGDPLYGDAAFDARARSVWGLTRLFLHAERLALPHPEDGRPVHVEAPLPQALASVVSRLSPI